jgi:hypothetical protein
MKNIGLTAISPLKMHGTTDSPKNVLKKVCSEVSVLYLRDM